MRSIKFILCGALFFCFSRSQAVAEENSPATRFLYVRHAEVPGNDPNPATYIYTGSGTDASLTDNGKSQAVECAKRVSQLQKKGVLDQIAALYSSDLKRAVETAEPIAEELGLAIQLRPNLREIYWGSADGQLVQKMAEKYGTVERQIKEQYPERKTRWDHLPVFEGAETRNGNHIAEPLGRTNI